MGLNALIHHYHPNLIDIPSLHPQQHKINLLNAFSVAEKHLGLSRILSPEDVDVDKPDEDSIILYLTMLYSVLFQNNSATCEPHRLLMIGKDEDTAANQELNPPIQSKVPSHKNVDAPVVKSTSDRALELDVLLTKYHKIHHRFSKWILKQIQEFSETMPPTSNIIDVQKKLDYLKNYRLGDKKSKYGKIALLTNQKSDCNKLLKEIFKTDPVLLSDEKINEVVDLWKLLEKIEQEWEEKLKAIIAEFSKQKSHLNRSEDEESKHLAQTKHRCKIQSEIRWTNRRKYVPKDLTKISAQTLLDPKMSREGPEVQDPADRHLVDPKSTNLINNSAYNKTKTKSLIIPSRPVWRGRQ